MGLDATLQNAVMQLFHIFSNTKPGEKLFVVGCGIQVLSCSLG